MLGDHQSGDTTTNVGWHELFLVDTFASTDGHRRTFPDQVACTRPPRRRGRRPVQLALFTVSEPPRPRNLERHGDPAHRLGVFQRQQVRKPGLTWADRALISLLTSVIPGARRTGLRFLASPDTVLRWHRDLLRRRLGRCAVRVVLVALPPTRHQASGPPPGRAWRYRTPWRAGWPW